MVASLTESELNVESERTSENILGEPGQHSVAGMVLGCLV
jgi:hypothetical protein